MKIRKVSECFLFCIILLNMGFNFTNASLKKKSKKHKTQMEELTSTGKPI
jgi:hypothetical protein